MLSVKDLKLDFSTRNGFEQVLDGINLEIRSEEIFGIVGETGCGKSVTALSILRLIPYPGKISKGEILFEQRDLLKLKEEELRTEIRGNKISMIFQEPMTSLNPVFTIGDQIGEVYELHQHLNKRESIKEAIEILKSIGMPDPARISRSYPHELSGGMRQRAMIAMALACRPALLIADEPTSSLDVATQAQVLELVKELRKTKTSVLMITHNFGVVAEVCDRVAVMYSGNIVECATVLDIFKDPKHPYTVGLLNAVPKFGKVSSRDRLQTIPGSLPNLANPPKGCRFHPRCSYSMDVCKIEKPQYCEIGQDHFVACHKFS